MKSKLRWLYPGIGVKRWIFLSAVGIILVSLSSASLVKSKSYASNIFSGLGLVFGALTIIIGIRELVTSVVNVIYPERSKELLEVFLEKKRLGKGPNIVAIGGGTGLSTLLQGLKNITANTTAIVTVADDGGSSGRLRRDFNTLPPGDIRNCLVALADAQPLMRELFQYRFEAEGDLKGHSFGNLFITALSQITGDFEKAIKESSKVLAIKGRVIPATTAKVQLIAEHINGKETVGESKIPQAKLKIKNVRLEPSNCEPAYEAIEAINSAEVIVFGPGSLYTSIIPNLLVPGMSEAINRSNATKIYVCNIMTQNGETDGYSVFDHIKALLDHSSPGLFQYCIVNLSFISEALLSRYKQEQSSVVEPDIIKVEKLGIRAIVRDLADLGDVVRHNPFKLAELILEVMGLDKGKGKWF
ncbi:MAG: YvcK family protein [Candidatus Omnitrophica bacterium]|nr:YvcK family protein [Candidatus Omnitrophota bacterium]